MPNVYALVTNRIIEQLEKGVIPWRKPWKGNPAMNYITRKPYRGVNPMLLPYSGEYLTFLQAKQLGGHVKKGEKGNMVIFYKPIEVEADDTETGDNKTIPFLKYSVVFHLSQIEGIQSKLLPVALDDEIKPIETAQKIIDGYVARSGVHINHIIGSDKAYYSPSTDTITLPEIRQFRKANDYYSVSFHEAAHSTGHTTRLCRDIGSSAFGSQKYSREELVAEIAAAMLMNEVGIEIPQTFENSASYIKSWLSKLRDDSKLIVTSSSAAQKASDLILGINPVENDV